MPPIIIRAITFPNKSPTTASVAPNDKEPTSPNQILAGKILKYKKAIKAPNQRAKKIDKGVSKIAADSIHRAKRQIISSPDAKPSKPSLILTALAKEIIIRAASGMKNQPTFKTPKKGI